MANLIIPGGTVPSLVAQITQASRQAGVNPCAAVAPRVEGLRPGLRAQMPVPPAAELRQRPSRAQTPAPQRSRNR